MTAKSRSALQTEINTLFADNTAGDISAQDLRTSLSNLIDSAYLNLEQETLTDVNLKDYGEVTNAIGSTGGGTQDIDLELGNVVSATVDTSANTFTFSNFTASDEGSGFTFWLTDGGSQTVIWPAAVQWKAGAAPTLAASGLAKLVFETITGGTVVTGDLVGQEYA